jgi:hypothetical protein
MVVTLASIFSFVARVAKLVDARDLKSLDRNVVPVRVRPRAPTTATVSAISTSSQVISENRLVKVLVKV